MWFYRGGAEFAEETRRKAWVGLVWRFVAGSRAEGAEERGCQGARMLLDGIAGLKPRAG